MAEINSRISSYLQKNSDVDSSTVKNAIENLKSALQSSYASGNESIFDIDGDMSESEFLSMMSSATGKNASDIENDVNILFNVLDTGDNPDGVLSKDELQFLEGRNKNIRTYDLYNKLSSYTEDEIETSSSSDSSSTANSATDGSTKTGTTSDAANDITTEEKTVDESNAAAAPDSSENTGTVSNDSSSSSSTSNQNVDFSDPESSKAFLEAFMGDDLKTYSDVIDWLLDNDMISSSDAKSIKETLLVVELSEDEQKMVGALMATGMSYEDALEKLQKSGKIGESENILDKEPEKTLNDVATQNIGDKLYNAMKGNSTDFWFGWGTNEHDVEEVFSDESLTSADWVKIVANYQGGDLQNTLVHHIDTDFSGEKQKEYMNKIVDNLLEEVKKGNKEALNVLCSQIYGATAAHLGTADSFLESLFSKISDEDLYKIVENYSSVTGTNFKEDIKNDHKGFLGIGIDSTGQKYLDKIDKVINKYGRS